MAEHTDICQSDCKLLLYLSLPLSLYLRPITIKLSLVWVGLVNITFSLHNKIYNCDNILKCDFKYILKAVEGKALDGN